MVVKREIQGTIYPLSGPEQMPLVEPLVKYGNGIHGINKCKI
jgi:hypothetical protein